MFASAPVVLATLVLAQLAPVKKPAATPDADKPTATQVLLTTQHKSPCTEFGYSGKPAKTLLCREEGPRLRTIRCQDGYVAQAPDKQEITLHDSVAFEGCKPIDACAVYGTSGQGQNARSCTNSGENRRTITCAEGTFVVKNKDRKQVYSATATEITLIGNAPFLGCIPTPP